MAFVTKYKITIKNWDGDTILAEIQEDGFAGTLQEFEPIGGNPITIEHQTNINQKESNIIPSRATVGLYVNYDWDLVELLYATARQFKLVITNDTDSQILFTGWIASGINQEDYYTGRYMVSLQATDGLLDLKDIPYLNSGALYDAFRQPLQIIHDCVTQTEVKLDLHENIDIYAETGMSITSTDSPLNQSYIHTSAYGDTIDNVLSCWDVLEAVCQAFYCRISQASVSALISFNTSIYLLSKIDKLGTTSTYREWEYNTSFYVYNGTDSIAPLLTMGTDIYHVNGRATIGVKQAYKEINLIGERGHGYNTLVNGGQFNDIEFTSPPQTTLTNWDALNICKLISTWSSPANNLDQVTIGGVSALEIGSHSIDHNSGVAGNNTQSNGGNVEFLAGTHSLTTSDWICVSTGQYRGIWKVISVSGTSSFTINATFVEAEVTRWFTINNLYGIESADALPLNQAIALEDNTTQSIKLEIEYNASSFDFRNAVVVVLIAQISSTSYKVLNNEGYWSDYNANEIHPIIIGNDNADRVTIDDDKIEVIGSLNSSNNFYTSTSHNMYLGLYSTNGVPMNYYNAKISITGGSDKEVTTSISANYIDELDFDFKHTDAEGLDNDEYRYINAIRDDATTKVCINSWKQAAGTADNLEDISVANLAAAYGDNSQIWSGTLRGDMSILNAVKDPLNFDRIFQIQRITRNLVDNFNSVGMIEIVPGGEPTFALSVSVTAQVEFDKSTPDGSGGFLAVGNQFATITNTGNAQVSVSATVTGDDSSYFSVVGASEFIIDVGKSAIVEIAVLQNQTEGVYVSSLVIAETRAYRTMTNKTAKLGHLNTGDLIQANNSVTDSQITSKISGVSVVNNSTNGTPNPTTVTITSIFAPLTWDVVLVPAGTPSGSATMRLSTDSGVVDSDVLIGADSGSVGGSLYTLAQAGTWDGENLNFDLI